MKKELLLLKTKSRNIMKRLAAGVLAAVVGLSAGTFTCQDIGEVKAASLNASLALNDTFVQGNIPEEGTVNFYEVVVPAAGWLTVTYQGWNLGDGYYQLVNGD